MDFFYRSTCSQCCTLSVLCRQLLLQHRASCCERSSVLFLSCSGCTKLRIGMRVTLWSSTSRLLGRSGLAIARVFWCSSSSSSPQLHPPRCSGSLLSSSIFSSSSIGGSPPLSHMPCPSFKSFGPNRPRYMRSPSHWSRPAGATIMSTTCTPSPSRSRSMFFVLFSMYNPGASNTTRFPFLIMFETDPSALLTLATWNFTFSKL